MRLPGFVGPSYPSQSPNANCQRTINWLAEVDETGTGKAPAYLYPTPGLRLFADLSDSKFTPEPPPPTQPIATIGLDPNDPQVGIIGLPFSHFLLVTDGEPPFVFAVVSGSLPDGVTLNADTGELSGTPTESGVFPYTVSVTSNATEVPATAQHDCVLTVKNPWSALPSEGRFRIIQDSSAPVLALMQDVALCLDHSTSFTADDITNEVAAANLLVDAFAPLNGAGGIGVFTFAGAVTELIGVSHNAELVKASMEGITPASYTALYQAIINAAAVSKAIILMTDGGDNPNRGDGIPDPSYAQAIAACVANGTKVYTIGFGASQEVSVLTSIANDTGGEYFDAATSANLKTIARKLLTTVGEVTY